MNVNIEPLFKPTTVAVIDAFAKRHDIQLPDDYRDFLTQYNGGQPKPNYCEITMPQGGAIVDVLFGFTETSGCNIDDTNDEYRDDLPPGFVIIGGDPGGAFYILGTIAPDAGIYFWDHQHFLDGSSEEDGNTYFIIQSFTDWLESLREMPQ